MRSVIVCALLGLGALGITATVPATADAAPRRAIVRTYAGNRSGYYARSHGYRRGYQYNRYNNWRGGYRAGHRGYHRGVHYRR